MSRSAIEQVILVERFPNVEDYRRIRALAGLAPKTDEASRRGLANTLYCVSLHVGNAIIGIGRVIGDNGCIFVVADIAVVPQWQGRGLGTQIMAALDRWLRSHVPESAYVTLVANGDAKHLYSKFGFAELTSTAVYMEYVMGPRGG